jgi:hypothetical protein
VEEAPKVLKSKTEEVKAPNFNIETTTMDAPDIIVPQQPVSAVSVLPPQSPFNTSVKSDSLKSSIDEKMARFKKDQEAQKHETSFNIETSTVDADIDIPKPALATKAAASW